MARSAIVFGLLLCGLTAVALFASMHKSPSQFVPMMFGIPTLFCGVVSLNPHRRRLAMPTAAALGAAGLLIAGGRTFATVLQLFSGRDVNRLAFAIVLAMTVICGLFVTAWLMSWIRVRRSQNGLGSSSGK